MLSKQLREMLLRWIPEFAYHLQWQCFQQYVEQELALKEMGAWIRVEQLELKKENVTVAHAFLQSKIWDVRYSQ
jgi:hypothetical protein